MIVYYYSHDIIVHNLVVFSHLKYTLEKTKGAIKNGRSRDTGNIGHT